MPPIRDLLWQRPVREAERSGMPDREEARMQRRRTLRINRPEPTEDRLLVTADAASRLGVSKDWLYRHADRVPFTVRLSEGQLRFSAKGIDRYIASREAKTVTK